MNVCCACGRDFASVEAFDGHRVGRHAYLWTPDRPDRRRCLSVLELMEEGWEQNWHGRWMHPRSLRKQRKRLEEGGYSAAEALQSSGAGADTPELAESE